MQELPALSTECRRRGDTLRLHSVLNAGSSCSVEEQIKVYYHFWREQLNNPQLNNWRKFAMRCMLAMPTSAASERVFSSLKRTLTDFQLSSLNDKVELSVMLEYNDPDHAIKK